MTVLRLLMVVASSADTPKSAGTQETKWDSISKHRIDQCLERMSCPTLIAAVAVAGVLCF